MVENNVVVYLEKCLILIISPLFQKQKLCNFDIQTTCAFLLQENIEKIEELNTFKHALDITLKEKPWNFYAGF